MVKYSNGCSGATHRATSGTQARECLRGSSFMYQVAINIEDGRFPWNIAHHMSIPDLIEHCFWHRVAPYPN
jgi:hypothetical protein